MRQTDGRNCKFVVHLKTSMTLKTYTDHMFESFINIFHCRGQNGVKKRRRLKACNQYSIFCADADKFGAKNATMSSGGNLADSANVYMLVAASFANVNVLQKRELTNCCDMSDFLICFWFRQKSRGKLKIIFQLK